MIVKFRARWSFLLTLTGLLIVSGCGGGGPRQYQVTGSVTYDGQPVNEGEIVFLPATSEGTPRAGRIVNGTFQISLPEGTKQVMITATRESATPAPDGLPNYENYIPAAYNTQTTLTAEVRSSGDNTLAFDLQPEPAQ